MAGEAHSIHPHLKEDPFVPGLFLYQSIYQAVLGSAFTPPATLRAVAHLIPAACPLLPPCEGKAAGQAGFDWELTLFQNDSPSP